MKTIFLDRDGTIIKEKDYLASTEGIELETGVLPALQLLLENNYQLIMVTNQSGIARHKFTLERFFEIQDHLLKLLEKENIFFKDYFYCPHHPTEGFAPYKQICSCRKPAPGMLLKAIEKYNINIQDSFMIGDKLADIEAGQKASLRSILVETGYGIKSIDQINNFKPDYIAKNLLDAVNNYILKA
jgi:D-glycero-D-manno-heptose 1,7-bisphosphate phosphatase